MSRATVGLVGARGHTGRELITLIAGHDGLDLAFASSRELHGRAVRDELPHVDSDVTFFARSPDDVARAGADVVILALPNGAAAPYVAALDAARPDTVIVDLSADFRFDDAWTYGLVERQRAHLAGARRIANPGCYATGMQLALAPFLEILDGPAHAFGVSGYSGAGTTPSRKNDVEVLRDNLLAYTLTGHTHEREVTRHLAHPVRFMPHVASFFRGIHLTIAFSVVEPHATEALRARARAHYESEPLVRVIDDVPEVKDAALGHGVTVGGIVAERDERRAVVCATLDNLLKGAATQALQNVNLALGLDELRGIPRPW